MTQLNEEVIQLEALHKPPAMKSKCPDKEGSKELCPGRNHGQKGAGVDNEQAQQTHQGGGSSNIGILAAGFQLNAEEAC